MARNKYPEITINRILDSATKLFLEKGYEKTTIQDIVNDLGDLSKGAIYHHFSSKEEIMQAVSDRMYANFDFDEVFKSFGENLNGLEKIRAITLHCMTNMDMQDWVKALPDFFKNPKFLAQELHESIEITAPMLVPYVQEGVEDGSIITDYPREAAEVLLLLMNIWVNPAIFRETKDTYTRKILFCQELLEKIGLPVINDQVMESALSFRTILSD